MNQREIHSTVNKAIKRYKGNAKKLETAIGMLHLGQHVGWKVLLLIHDKKSIREYEKILGIDIRKDMPDKGELADKSVAWDLVKKVSNYWKAVKGEIPGKRSPELK